MQFQIIGALSGRAADVTTRSRLRTISTSLGPGHDVAYKDQLTWTLATTVTPAGAGNFFFYLRNASALRDLWISRIQVRAGTAEQVLVRPVSGTPVGGTAIVPTNRSVGVNRTFSGVVEQGTNITGLTAAGDYERLVIPAAGKDVVDLIQRPIYLVQNTTSAAIALSAVTGAIALNVLVDVVVRSWDNEDLI